MQRRFWAGAVRPFGFPSLNVLRLPSKRLRNRHLAWGQNASKSSFERTIAACAGSAAAWRYDSDDDSERGGDDDFNDNCEVHPSEDAEMMGYDTWDDDYAGS